MINRERAGDSIDREQMKNCIEVFVVMGLCRGPNSKELKDVDKMLKMQPELEVYTTDFEEPFLKSTEQYYETNSTGWRDSDSVPDYLKRTEAALEEETDRVQAYLNSSTHEKLQIACVRVLLSKPQQELVDRANSGMYALLTEVRWALRCVLLASSQPSLTALKSPRFMSSPRRLSLIAGPRGRPPADVQALPAPWCRRGDPAHGGGVREIRIGQGG